MAEFLSIRRAAGTPLEVPGRALQHLPLRVDAAIQETEARWCGDFTATSHGFGHVKILPGPPPPGTFGLRGDTVHVIVVCDGFHRGMLADQGLRLVMVAGPRGLGTLAPSDVQPSMLAHAELDVVLRPAYTWKHPVTSGRGAELQVAAVHLLASELEALAADHSGLEIYFSIHSGRGVTYINLDGVPGHNFQIDGTWLHPAPT
ncbi:MAG: hypothetical protein ABIJ09_09610 [Pseudomonadota bacterium]